MKKMMSVYAPLPVAGIAQPLDRPTASSVLPLVADRLNPDVETVSNPFEEALLGAFPEGTSRDEDSAEIKAFIADHGPLTGSEDPDVVFANFERFLNDKQPTSTIDKFKALIKDKKFQNTVLGFMISAGIAEFAFAWADVVKTSQMTKEEPTSTWETVKETFSNPWELLKQTVHQAVYRMGQRGTTMGVIQALTPDNPTLGESFGAVMKGNVGVGMFMLVSDYVKARASLAKSTGEPVDIPAFYKEAIQNYKSFAYSIPSFFLRNGLVYGSVFSGKHIAAGLLGAKTGGAYLAACAMISFTGAALTTCIDAPRTDAVSRGTKMYQLDQLTQKTLKAMMADQKALDEKSISPEEAVSRYEKLMKGFVEDLSKIYGNTEEVMLQLRESGNGALAQAIKATYEEYDKPVPVVLQDEGPDEVLVVREEDIPLLKSTLDGMGVNVDQILEETDWELLSRSATLASRRAEVRIRTMQDLNRGRSLLRENMQHSARPLGQARQALQSGQGVRVVSSHVGRIFRGWKFRGAGTGGGTLLAALIAGGVITTVSDVRESFGGEKE